MPVLKEEIRNDILESTRQDIITYGLDNVSLRRIARNIGMSPSNIYNYFKSKKELIDYIVSPSIKKIDELLNELSDNMINFDLGKIKKSRKKYVKFSVEQFAVRLFELYKKFDKSVLIILSSDQYINSMNKWLCSVLYDNYDSFFIDEGSETEKKFLIELIASALIQGFKKTLDNVEYCYENDINVSKLLERYLNIFLS